MTSASLSKDERTDDAAPEPSRDRGPVVRRLADPNFWVDWAAPIGLVVLLVFFGIASSGFLAVGNLQAILAAAAIPMVLAVGQTFVIMTAGIDLSVASTMTFAAIILGKAVTGAPGLVWALVLAVVAGTVVGAVNGTVIAKGRIADFIVTLGALSAASGLALIVANGNPVTVIDTFLLKLSTTSFAGVLSYPVVIAVVVAVIAHLVLFHTRFGTHVLATGGSPEAAEATGIRIDRIKIAVYTISGLLAGVAAILLVARVGAAEPASNTTFLLNSVAGVVLGGVSLFGGRGSVFGPVAGALLLTVLTSGLTAMHVPEFYQPLAVGIVVVAAAFLSRTRR
ncbi:ribose transport system permease protein [Jatrophihabitans endophyticus]|uniref:Ribose transport system permease protein n=1 Tax=Jatrophihabitans endophyticus TaxID=1206085 RepID=A0A1M5RBW1_9ACTN|nr:ABC transporter permease [Jatrophihabitans endophyticus]SHH23834.1 ribose transport system permease protein [Jatrophihabitans endophyticus]